MSCQVTDNYTESHLTLHISCTQVVPRYISSSASGLFDFGEISISDGLRLRVSLTWQTPFPRASVFALGLGIDPTVAV